MSTDELRCEVEFILRRSQVNAVVRSIQEGHRPRVGEVLEHTLERPFGSSTRSWTRDPRLDRYEFEVEAWHLAEAEAESTGCGVLLHR